MRVGIENFVATLASLIHLKTEHLKTIETSMSLSVCCYENPPVQVSVGKFPCVKKLSIGTRFKINNVIFKKLLRNNIISQSVKKLEYPTSTFVSY